MIINTDSLEFENIGDLSIFVRYNSKNDKSVPAGYVLAEDVVNDKGGVLYAKNSEIDAVKIGRLMRIIENNPDIKPNFVINLTDTVIKIEHAKLLSALNRLIESKATRMEFSKLMKTVKSVVESRINDILRDQDITLFISKMKFLEDKTKKTKITPFYNHMLNTLIFSLGIASNLKDLTQETFDPKELGSIGLIALLHAAGGWETSGDYQEHAVDDRKAKYIEANSKNRANLKQYSLDDTELDAIDYCAQFQDEKFDFFEEDSKASKFAQIVSVASLFDQSISGLWGQAKTPREVLDSLYVKAQIKKVPKLYVDALALGLKFSDLFDFYHELEILNKSCERDSGKPYPMSGFKSPVIYVCKYNLEECREFVASAKSITIFREIGELKEGSYGRCEGLSDSLVKFYDEHYQDIKEDVLEKQLGLTRKQAQKDAAAQEDTESQDAGTPPAKEEKPSETPAKDAEKK